MYIKTVLHLHIRMDQITNNCNIVIIIRVDISITETTNSRFTSCSVGVTTR